MVNKIIIDGNSYTLSGSTVFPFTYEFSRAGIHNVRIGLENTNDICAYAFQNCTDLTKVTFPDIITGIKRNAFENCSKLEKITIPEQIQYVGPNVFNGCSKLKEIQFTNRNEGQLDPPEIFYSTLSSITTCYIPDGSKYTEVTDYSDLVLDGSVQYYTKDNIGNYKEIDYELLTEEFLSDGGKYYYTKWNKVHNYLNVIEERFRVRPTSINFIYNGEPINTFEQTFASSTERTKQLYPISLNPNNITNTKITYVSSDSSVARIIDQENGYFIIPANASGTAQIYACTEPFYDGTYYNTRLRVLVSKQDANVKTLNNETSFEIEVGTKYNLNDYIVNTIPGLKFNFALSTSTNLFTIINSTYIIANAVNETCNVIMIMEQNSLYQQSNIALKFSSIASNKKDPAISFNSNVDSQTLDYSEEDRTINISDLISITYEDGDDLFTFNYSSNNTELCVIENDIITVKCGKTGTASIIIEFDGNAKYNAKALTYTITVNGQVPEEVGDVEIEMTPNSNHQIQVINMD